MLNGNATLLQAGDPAAFGLENPAAKSPILFISDHAGRAFPKALGTLVPGNANVSAAERQRREREILEPYHREIERVLADRAARRQPTAIICMHSCTDRLKRDKERRPWHVGVIADSDWRIGNPLIELLEAETQYRIGRNQPYSVSMEADYTVPIHCEARGIPYVEIELRQDLIGDEKSQREWAKLLADIFPRAVEKSDVLAA
jgi:predicted N-formylglutamate amidohydrolase